MTEEVIKEVRARNDELGDATKRWEELRQVDDIFVKNKQALIDLNQPAGQPPFPGQPADADARRPRIGLKSLGQHLVDHQSYKSVKGAVGGRKTFSIDLEDFDFTEFGAAVKTTMTTAAGFAPANDRTNIVIPFPTRRPMLQDFIPSITTNLDAIKFMEETTFTNNAAGTAENNALPESAMAYTERTQPVEVIGTFLPVTEQQLDIEEAVRGTVDQRLLLMYTLKEESDLLSGNGSSPNLLGYLNKGGIQTQAKGADPVPDCLYKLFTKLRGGSNAGFVEPTAVVIHPNDWQDIRILRDSNGNYIWGNPSEAGPERIWGKPMIITTAITENTALSGDFQLFSQIWRKRGARVEAGMQNDDFVKLKMTLRVYGRLALVIYRAAAYGTATGI
jgi:HK97 family phage major capsid protein